MMPKYTKTCRVCGSQYEACNSVKTGSQVFNWREVACSAECGMEYLRRVNEARNPTPKTKRGQRTKVAVFEEPHEVEQASSDITENRFVIEEATSDITD